VKSLPNFLRASGDTMYPARSAMIARNGANAVLVVIFTVSASTAEISLMSASSARRADAFAGSSIQSKLYFTAAASQGVPSWNLTFGRSLNT